MTKYIEIKGVQFNNKGAELMLYTLHEWLQEIDGLRYELVLPKRNTTTSDLKRYDALPKAGALYKRFDWSIFTECVPKALRSSIRCISHSDIDIVLDASGYSYGAPWRVDMTLHSARQAQITSNNGGKYIVLPQAFGEFTTPRYRDAIRKLVNYSEIVFVRDPRSMENLHNVCGLDLNKLRLNADFTPYSSVDGVKARTKILSIIPNGKMIDKRFNNCDMIDNYYEFLAAIISSGVKQNYEVQLIDHGGKEDRAIIKKIVEKSNLKNVRILENLDARQIKKAISESDIVFSSRYHASISALSSNIPCFSTSWSHKYEYLYKYYECDDLMIRNFNITDLSYFEDLANKYKINIKKNSEKHLQESQKFFNYLENVVR